MVFNLQGSEIIIILLLALVVLGPEKLPDAIRKFNQTFGELKKMGSGFQSELKSALDEPMREMRNTTDIIRDAADPSKYVDAASPASPDATTAPRVEAAALPLTPDSPEAPDAVAPPNGPEPVDGPDAAHNSGPESGDATAGHDVAVADPSDPGSETVATAGDPPAAPSPDVDGSPVQRDGEPASAGADNDRSDVEDLDDGGLDHDVPDGEGDEVEATGETATA